MWECYGKQGIKLELPSLMHMRIVSEWPYKNEYASNFQFLSLPSYAHLSFLLHQIKALPGCQQPLSPAYSSSGR